MPFTPPTNQASRYSCVVPVLPATNRPAIPAAVPLPRETTAAIIRSIIAATSGSITRVTAFAGSATATFARTLSMLRGTTRIPPLKNAA